MTHAERHECRQKMVEMGKAGATLREIAAHFGATLHTVRENVPQYKIEGHPFHVTRDDYRRKNIAIVELAEAGASKAEIARQCGLSRQRVYQIIARAGIYAKTSDFARRKAAAVADVTAGMTVSEAAKKHRLSVCTVRSLSRNAGIAYPRSTASTMLIAARLLTSDATKTDVAKEFNVVPAQVCTVAARLREHGFGEFIKSRDGRSDHSAKQEPIRRIGNG